MKLNIKHVGVKPQIANLVFVISSKIFKRTKMSTKILFNFIDKNLIEDCLTLVAHV